jgi:hypothetical protein
MMDKILKRSLWEENHIHDEVDQHLKVHMDTREIIPRVACYETDPEMTNARR